MPHLHDDQQARSTGTAGVRHRGTAHPLLALQARAGNAATTTAVQRFFPPAPGLGGDVGSAMSNTAGAVGDTAEQNGPPGPGNALGDGTGPVTITGSSVEMNAGMVNMHSGLVRADGVLQCDTIVANSVIASSYTPGAGNAW